MGWPMYDAVTLLNCLLAGLIVRRLAPRERPRRAAWAGLLFAGGIAVVAVRLLAGAYPACAAATAVFGLLFGLGAVDTLANRRTWPPRAVGVALCVLTAAAAFPRAIRFEQVREDALFPDVVYYRQQAQRTWSPFAAGNKAPLWSALHAPIVRWFPDDPGAMRIPSCLAGIAAVPLTGAVLGRFLGAPVGIVVAGLCAFDTWMIDLSCQGLREDANLILWLLFFRAAFPAPKRASPPPRGRDRGWLAAGVTGGLLLLLRNTNLPALTAMLLCMIALRRWRPTERALAVALPLAIVSPFYLNQWRHCGDPFHLERRDARYYCNGEFGAYPTRPLLPVAFPAPEVMDRDPFAGEPVSPLDYLFRMRPPGEALRNQASGVGRAMIGLAFGWQPVGWFGVLCAAGLAGMLVRPTWWMPLFFLSSVAGMPAHLIAIGRLEQRMLLQAYPFWLAGGVMLLWIILRRGVEAYATESGRRGQANGGDTSDGR